MRARANAPCIKAILPILFYDFRRFSARLGKIAGKIAARFKIALTRSHRLRQCVFRRRARGGIGVDLRHRQIARRDAGQLHAVVRRARLAAAEFLTRAVRGAEDHTPAALTGVLGTRATVYARP